MSEATTETVVDTVKGWSINNIDDIIMTTVMGAAVVGMGVIVKLARDDAKKLMKREADRRKDLNDWENEQRSQGRVLYELADGRVLSVTAIASQETYIQ